MLESTNLCYITLEQAQSDNAIIEAGDLPRSKAPGLYNSQKMFASAPQGGPCICEIGLRSNPRCAGQRQNSRFPRNKHSNVGVPTAYKDQRRQKGHQKASRPDLVETSLKLCTIVRFHMTGSSSQHLESTLALRNAERGLTSCVKHNVAHIHVRESRAHTRRPFTAHSHHIVIGRRR